MAKIHSVLLKEDKCEGCTNCVKDCPTRAIRVHGGKANIKDDFCIDCAECIRTCEHNAKYIKAHDLKQIDNFKYSAALIPPSFYGQFTGTHDPRQIMSGLHKLGFTKVYNVAKAAEALTRRTVSFLGKQNKFYISSSCPVVVRFVQKMYPELVDHLLPFKSPVEITAQRAHEEIKQETGLTESEIGVFFITPCSAKLTSVEMALGHKLSYLDGAIAVREIYDHLYPLLKKKNSEKCENKDDENYKLEKKDSPIIPYAGIKWGQSGGEEDLLQLLEQLETLTISGLEEVRKALAELARNNLSGVKYLEMVSCPQGCVGGVLNVCNPYQAKHNIKTLARERGKKSKFVDRGHQVLQDYDFALQPGFSSDQRGELDSDMDKALEKLARLEEVEEMLPGLNCASCGAPDCETLAEDIVKGQGQRTDCIFMLRQEIQRLAEQVSSLSQELPPVISEENSYSGDEAEQ